MSNPSTPFVGGTSVFPNTNLTPTPGSASAEVEWTDVVDTPTTLAGYGITDAMDLSTNQTANGEKTFVTSPIAPGMTGDDATNGLFFQDTSVAGDGIDITSENGNTNLTAIGASGSISLSANLAVSIAASGVAADISLNAPTIDLIASTKVDATGAAEVLVPTPAVDDNSHQAADTAYVIGQAGAATPIVDGTGTAGSSTRWSRQDHVHPTDTSRAPLASPAFTGTPTAPTAAALTDNTQIATTAYADTAVAVEKTRALAAEALLAPLASPALTGNPTAPTQATGDNSTKIATTAFVNGEIAANGSAAYTAHGTFTYTIPTGLNYLRIWLWSAGAGGGSGRSGSAGEASVGGGGGGGGSVQGPIDIPASLFSTKGDTQLTVTVGQGGAGGTGVTTGNNGNPGTRVSVATSIVGVTSGYTYAQTANQGNTPTGGGGGQAAAGGAAGTGAGSSNAFGPGAPSQGAGGGAANSAGGVGGAGSQLGGASSNVPVNSGASGGGAGGGVNTSNTAANGGAGGAVGWLVGTAGTIQQNPGGIAPGNSPVPNTAIVLAKPIGGYAGAGGGGGAGNSAGNGGNGQDGNFPGGGGGGGGACHGGTSGKGGNGADGAAFLLAA